MEANTDMRESIIEFVRRRDHVSFVELMDFLRAGDFPDVDGDHALEAAPNVILWLGMSQRVTQTLMALRREGRLFAHPTHHFTYLVDGGMPNFPLAKRPLHGGYKTLHWLPVTLRVVPFESKAA